VSTDSCISTDRGIFSYELGNEARVELSNRSTSIRFDDWIDERNAAEALWLGHFIHAKDWLVHAIENWIASLKSDKTLSKDQLLPIYGKVGIITFAVQAIEDYACTGYAYLKALEEGVERIYEYVRDFGMRRKKRSRVERFYDYIRIFFGMRRRNGRTGTVGEFFKRIFSDDQALHELTGFQPGSDDFTSTRDHLRSVYEFYKKYRLLYLKFKHGQAFIPLIWQGRPAVYIIPKEIERQHGKVKLPKNTYLVMLDECELARDITLRINVYFLQIRTLSQKLFPRRN